MPSQSERHSLTGDHCTTTAQCSQEGHVPDYLKYRDEGHMYFPCVELLPFLKAVDMATKKEINNTTFSQQGSDMLTAIVEKVHGDPNLQSLFVTTVITKVSHFDSLPFTTLDVLFKELEQKLSHIRIQEYLDAFKHKGAAHKGNSRTKFA